MPVARVCNSVICVFAYVLARGLVKSVRIHVTHLAQSESTHAWRCFVSVPKCWLFEVS